MRKTPSRALALGAALFFWGQAQASIHGISVSEDGRVAATFPSDGLLRILSPQGPVLAEVRDLSYPTGVLWDGDFLWCIEALSMALSRLDPPSFSKSLSLSLPRIEGRMGAPSDLCRSGNSLLVSDPGAGEIWHVDLDALSVNPISCPFMAPSGVCEGDLPGSFWCADHEEKALKEFVLLDSVFRMRRTFPLQQPPMDVAEKEGRLWVIHPGTSQLAVLDPVSGTLRITFEGASLGLLGGARTLALGEGVAWVGDTTRAAPLCLPLETWPSVPGIRLEKDALVLEIPKISPGPCDVHLRGEDVDLSLPVTFQGQAWEASLKGLTKGQRYSFEVSGMDLLFSEESLKLRGGLWNPSSQPRLSYITLDVLVAVFPEIEENGRRVSTPRQDLMRRVGEEFEEARFFYWAQSGCLLNLVPTFILVEDVLKSQEGWFSPEAALPLIRTSLSPDTPLESFDSVIALTGADRVCAPGPMGRVYGGGLTWPGYSVFSVADTLCWLVVHEFHHQLDGFFEVSGVPHYPFCHPEEANMPGFYGEHFDVNAFILRTWPRELWWRLSTGTFCETRDRDGDHVPDRDPRVPMDESRFQSSAHREDTDRDGLTDLEELRAGLYGPSNPNREDTDQDGVMDGADAYPLDEVDQDRFYSEPNLDGVLSESEWQLLGEKEGVSFYFSWSDHRMNLAWQSSRPLQVTLAADTQGDGWFVGEDQVVWQIQDSGDPISVAMTQGREAWDEGRGVRGEAGGKRTVEAVLPVPTHRSRLKPGEALACRVEFHEKGAPPVHLFQPYQLVKMSLRRMCDQDSSPGITCEWSWPQGMRWMPGEAKWFRLYLLNRTDLDWSGTRSLALPEGWILEKMGDWSSSLAPQEAWEGDGFLIAPDRCTLGAWQGVLQDERGRISSFDNFVSPSWEVAGPFDAPGGDALDLAFWPEEGGTPPAADQGWTALRQEALGGDGYVDLIRQFGYRSNVVAYLRCELFSDSGGPCVLGVGSDDSPCLWMNGELLLKKRVARRAMPGQERVEATLKQGLNVCLLKICQGGAQWGAYLDVLESQGPVCVVRGNDLRP